MAINLYDTYTMMEAVKLMPPRSTFLRDRYFPTSPQDIFETNSIIADYNDAASNLLAPVVLPEVGGIPMGREGYSSQVIEPPTIAPKIGLSAAQLAKRMAGEGVVGGMSPQERAAAYLASDLQKLTDAIDAQEEYMAAQVLQNNGYTLSQYGDKYGSVTEKVDYSIKFYTEQSNPAVHTINTKWDQSGADPVSDIADMAEINTKKGLPATDLVVGSDAADELLGNADVLKLLDNRRFILAKEVNPEENSDGSVLLAVLNVKGHMVNIFSYTREYKSGSTTAPFVNAKNVIMCYPGLGRTAYGAVTQMDENENFETYAAKRVPQVLADRFANTRELVVRAKPIVMPKVRNCFVCAQAVT